MGLVDLHLHLLPGVDDGCRDLDESLELARILVKLGFSIVAPSPHHALHYATEALARTRLGELREALGGAGVALELVVNAESAFQDERLLGEVAAGTARTLGGSGGRTLLVEAPYSTPLPALVDLIFRMKRKGLTPLIAHPERCLEFSRVARAADAVRAGALLQLDVGALVGRYGRDAAKISRQLLDDGLYAVAATDLHSPVGAERWVAESLRALQKHAGSEGLERLFRANPERLIRGEALD